MNGGLAFRLSPRRQQTVITLVRVNKPPGQRPSATTSSQTFVLFVGWFARRTSFPRAARLTVLFAPFISPNSETFSDNGQSADVRSFFVCLPYLFPPRRLPACLVCLTFSYGAPTGGSSELVLPGEVLHGEAFGRDQRRRFCPAGETGKKQAFCSCVPEGLFVAFPTRSAFSLSSCVVR